jgi:protein TonB
MNRRLRTLCCVTLAAGMTIAAGCGEAPPSVSRPAPTPPLARDTPPPVYPEALACDGIGGQVIVRLRLGVDGRPADVRVQSTSRYAPLDAAAVEAVRGWQFAPATAAGKPTTTTIQVPVTFTPPTMRPERCFVLDEERNRAQQR